MFFEFEKSRLVFYPLSESILSMLGYGALDKSLTATLLHMSIQSTFSATCI